MNQDFFYCTVWTILKPARPHFLHRYASLISLINTRTIHFMYLSTLTHQKSLSLWKWTHTSLRGVVFRVHTYSSLFITACQHDKGLYILLPDHPPELADCGGQRTLSCNELFSGVVTLPNKTLTQPQNTNIHFV